MHVIRYLTENQTSTPEGVSFPHDPAMIVICPTKALEEEMVSNTTLQLAGKLGHQRGAAKETPPHNEVPQGVTMILVSPEQLQSSTFEGVLEDKLFMGRTTILEVGEVHLLVAWDKVFRKAYEQVGWVHTPQAHSSHWRVSDHRGWCCGCCHEPYMQTARLNIKPQWSSACLGWLGSQTASRVFASGFDVEYMCVFGPSETMQVCSHRRYASFLASGLQETHEGYQRHEGCTEVAMDSFEIRECQKTLMGLLELNTHAES
ncbi:hypothetical protein K503DRAFT_785575 [Rhizopogon vinicolor AM-OR11-026]|uniref:DEAD/DEAH box helicase domain-containing protein n=1 Tax=Rhizopogon vinicolor AM-OR11-026 TaxID=1314800 RepID=A0A1B7MQ58_9AGAM|nr:hypothetical protein K503DRAFT_785575 [Rhizopogon vinicolor AM-OR11-026]